MSQEQGVCREGLKKDSVLTGITIKQVMIPLKKNPTAEILHEIERIKLHWQNFAQKRHVPVVAFGQVFVKNT